ncbi:hypothetical protein AA23498_0979 [Acetobacter nitrogenifigens DSM 23921 = NBRC 105050]|uniref:DUF202 domain-containing protein n=1 Tax=Acetobacter nitrogenifigens DSM 23921 = NBRC 105050 TaxID=1120919 RepID=A0A511XBE0_9PROT|nr:DUF202 domain-containing protein [Acetobacter nitrogenifigens]GBQ90792.1 hypothetical protein AA23498_0979 [Acetobacter nitrogenifigens DSM 23921 = NBRC 105050]GEN60250.1 hypothetical protein ANI02nite_21340 [Acetobacter nitrogenifigens DSM 23921 = NBRC 105050]
MIPRYTDHAANERTFLAWVRTALAILAFGGVLTKFDLFLRLVAAQHDAGAPRPYGATAELGVTFVALGIVLFVAAYRRFRVTRDAISAETELRSAGPAMERALTIVLAALGCGVLAALVRAIVS